MSQMSQPVATASPQFVMVPVRESNGLGVAGFFIALIGLVIPTGIVALLGLLVSLVALGKAPRGFAGMGVVIGLLGTVFWAVLTGVAVLAAVAVGVVALVFSAGMFIVTQPEIVEVTSDMVNMSLALVEYQKDNGKLPQEVAVLGLGVSTMTDPWGNAYRYEVIDEDPGFDVISSGSDGIPGTADDLALSELDLVWQDAVASFGGKMEEFSDRLNRLDGTRVRFDRHAHRHGDDTADRYERAAAEAIESVKASKLALAEAIEQVKAAETAAATAESDDPDDQSDDKVPND